MPTTPPTYLFGDSTAFPVNANFIAVLRDLVDACVSILQVDEALESVLQQVEGEVTSAERGTAGLDTLAASVAATIETQRERTESSFVGEIATRVMRETMQVLDAARREAMSRGGMAQAEAQAKVAARRAKLLGVLERFLLEHELPETQWGLIWTCSTPEAHTEAQAVATTPVGLEANFELAIRSGRPFAGAVKVGDLRSEVSISFPKRGTFSSEAKLKVEKLDKYQITEVNLAPDRALMTLRKALKPSSPGFEISLRSPDQTMPTIRALDDPSRPDGLVPPDSGELVALEDLWRAIDLGLRPLLSERARLVEASLDDVPITAVDPPARIAAALIDSVASIVRDLRRRSPVPAELSLKRPQEPGRREELYIAIADLDAMIAPLSPPRRALFDSLGLHAPPPIPPPAPRPTGDIFDAATTQVTGPPAVVRPSKSTRPPR